MPLLIVGTQIDLRNDPSHLEKLARQKQKPIRSEEAAETAKQVGAVKYVECSALTQKGLKNVFDEVRLSPSRVFGCLAQWGIVSCCRMWMISRQESK